MLSNTLWLSSWRREFPRVAVRTEVNKLNNEWVQLLQSLSHGIWASFTPMNIQDRVETNLTPLYVEI